MSLPSAGKHRGSSFDQDLTTMAHSNWFTRRPKQSATPMTITTELDGVYDLDHVTYVPREDGGNGTCQH